jgi:predicted RNA binding protein YcfA (HicA-like mRNA interferase family)
MKVREVLRLLAEDGWEIVATRGSHRQLKHSKKPGRVTVAGKASDDLHPKTAASILRQAGLKR